MFKVNMYRVRSHSAFSGTLPRVQDQHRAKWLVGGDQHGSGLLVREESPDNRALDHKIQGQDRTVPAKETALLDLIIIVFIRVEYDIATEKRKARLSSVVQLVEIKNGGSESECKAKSHYINIFCKFDSFSIFQFT
jgi:hypothetical protein